VILCDSIWKRRFGGDPNIIGKGVRFAGAERVVVGVLPEDFRLRLSVGIPTDIEAFTPFQSNIYKGPRTLYFLRVIARMKPGVRVEQAQQEMNRIASEIRGSYVEYKAENLKLNIVGMQADAVRDIRPALVALFAGAGFVMLICCVNVANLLLARASERKKEVAVRSAIGASRSRVLRQLLTEGLLMCAIASAFGTGLAWAALRGLLKLQPDALTRAGVIGINWPVLGFVGLISIASVVLFGLAPSVESAKWDLITTLRESGRSSQGTVRQGVRAALIVAEIAIGFVLMVGAGLMIRTFAKVDQVRPGFESQGVLTFSLNLPRFASQQAMFNFVREWEAQAGSMPGVEAVGGSSHLPLDDYPNWYSPFRPEGVSSVEGAAFLADHRAVTPGYLKAMGTRLIEGRYFDDQDRADGRQVVIVDELLASTTWPGRSAVGKRIESEHFTAKGIEPVWADVVGVVEHVRSHSLSKKVRPEIYIPFEQSPRSPLSFAVRARVDPVALAGPIREMLHRRDPNIAISKVRPMAAYVEKAKAPASFTAVLAGIFGGLALILAAVGIYGVVYYSVSRRIHELGVRMALGATGRDVRGLILREGLMLTAIGLLLGVAGGVVVSRELRDLIYGISAMDGITYGIAFTVLPLAALSGCWRPALKASSANPLDAIRAE
jgi:putative ABC transport system permease protein